LPSSGGLSSSELKPLRGGLTVGAAAGGGSKASASLSSNVSLIDFGSAAASCGLILE
jgi:hypothetical protein